MNEATLVSQNRAAEILAVRPHTIGDLVKKLGIQTHAMTNGQANGLDADAMQQLRRALTPRKRRTNAVA